MGCVLTEFIEKQWISRGYMIESLSDIEALATRCRSEQSRSYVSEAIKCYKSGAYRAAIVTTWIAVVFDLIDKIRELSLAGDKAAKELEEKYENYVLQIDRNSPQGIKGALEFERGLIDSCKIKLQFFDAQQYIDLVRLKEDRHRCAHPSFQKVGIPYEPSAEQSRLHIRNAVVHVLSQPPVQGKAALAELKSLVESKYFPEDENKALIQLKGVDFDNANKVLVKRFTEFLVDSFLMGEEVLYLQRRCFTALNAAFELYPEVVEERLGVRLNKLIRNTEDERFSNVARIISNVSQGWSVLDDFSKNKMVGFVENADIKYLLPGLRKLHLLDGLRDAVQKRVDELNYDDLVAAVRHYNLGAVGKDKALSFLQRSGTWDRTNKIFKNLIFPLFEELNDQDIEKILKMPAEHDADLIGANEFEKFIVEIKATRGFDEEKVESLLVTPS